MSAASAPPTAGPPLVLAPMKLTMEQMKGAIELFLDADGKTVVSVLADGTLRMDASGDPGGTDGKRYGP